MDRRVSCHTNAKPKPLKGSPDMPHSNLLQFAILGILITTLIFNVWILRNQRTEKRRHAVPIVPTPGVPAEDTRGLITAFVIYPLPCPPYMENPSAEQRMWALPIIQLPTGDNIEGTQVRFNQLPQRIIQEICNVLNTIDSVTSPTQVPIGPVPVVVTQVDSHTHWHLN